MLTSIFLKDIFVIIALFANFEYLRHVDIMLVGGVRQLHHLSVLNLQEEKLIQDLGDTVRIQNSGNFWISNVP
jgi:hypothetical protein